MGRLRWADTTDRAGWAVMTALTAMGRGDRLQCIERRPHRNTVHHENQIDGKTPFN
ncbi:hypothetical protein [Paenibacillus qinlingensis]|uniref:hypothetical protein n=1 Tax=Paenibacillus qinlingensis TaxID=1837343 RepID=UPI00156426BC|nr:hypothetical protein [Paenibacillus qinlingensis]NQX64354.1 hypothetical protein [Paenibacillus qinlingensis]